MFIPRFYGGTKALKARVSSAVMQKNEGCGWLSKVSTLDYFKLCPYIRYLLLSNLIKLYG